MNEDGIEPALSPAAAGVPASPVIEPAAEAPPTIRPMPRARATVSGGLDLSLLASGELRRASLYIGLLTLLLVGPFVVTVLAFGAVQGGFDWIPEALSGLSPSIIAVPDSFWSFLSVSGIVAVLGLMVVTVESQIMAAAILGGRALGRPMTMREALRRSRQVFWRVVRASILVFLILLVPTVILNFWLQSVFGATSEAPTVIVTAVGAVIGAPFIYIVSGIVLGDVGASEAVRRSTVLARASWRLAIVVSAIGAAISYIELFATGVAVDLLSRFGSTLHLGFDSTAGTLALTVLVLAGVLALGSLTFTLAALRGAPQVVAFLGITGYGAGLDRSRGPSDGKRSERWVSIPMEIGIFVGVLAGVLAILALG